VKLTAQAVAKLKPSTTRRDVKDDFTPGLYLRIQPTGTKTWRFRYKTAGHVRVLTLGDAGTLSPADARRQAHEALAKVRKGEDPGAEAQLAAAERRRMPTVAEFADEYIERYARLRKRSWDEDRRMIANWLTPHIGRMKMDAVHRRDIVAVLDTCRDAGNTRMPGKILAVARKLFRFAIERGVIDATPVALITERQPRPARRAMTADDIRAWWQGGDRVSAPAMLALRLLLLTGQRPGEVAGLRVAEIDLEATEGPVWRIPADRRKGGLQHAVALTPAAVDVITEALTLADGVHLFPNATGGPGRVDSGLNRSLRLIFGNVPGRPTPHAARHTVATELEGLGCEEGEIARVLGHKSTTVTGSTYINRRSLNAQRQTLEMWERRLTEIITGAQPATVTPLRRARADGYVKESGREVEL
jgi:integrase